jgi:hypothetical protein
MERREKIPPRPGKSVIATLTVKADNRAASARGGGAGVAKRKAMTGGAVKSCRNGIAGSLG